jgi:hypothetical protein
VFSTVQIETPADFNALNEEYRKTAGRHSGDEEQPAGNLTGLQDETKDQTEAVISSVEERKAESEAQELEL